MGDLVELDRHQPSVGSHLGKLTRYKGKIQALATVILWDDGSFQLSTTPMKTTEMMYAANMMFYEAHQQAWGRDGG